MKKIEVKCECEGTGFIAVADNGGDGVEHVECGQHHPAYDKLFILDEVRIPSGAIGKVVGFSDLGPYTVCVGTTASDGEYIRRWYSRDELTTLN